MRTVFTVKLHSKFKPLTQKIQITKTRIFEKMTGDEAYFMTSLVLILAIFLRKRRSFFRRMRLMSRHIGRMRHNVVIRSIQHQNNRNRRKHKTMCMRCGFIRDHSFGLNSSLLIVTKINYGENTSG